MRRIAAVVVTLAVIIGGLVVAPMATAGPAPTPSRGQPVLAVSAWTTCAVRESGRVYCWGSNSAGELGRGNTTPSTAVAPTIGIIDAIAVYGAAELDFVGGTFCALRENHTVVCWGRGGAYQVGNASTSNVTSPFTVPGLDHVASMDLSDRNTCAVKQDGTVWCWGWGTPVVGGTLRTAPYQIPGVSSAVSVAVGDTSACVLKVDRSVWCWGANDVGQLGNAGAGASSAAPVRVDGLSAATAVASGPATTCALLLTKAVWCWGSNSIGQLGRGSGVDFSVQAKPIKGNLSASYLSVATAVACAFVGTDIKCWGRNDGGVLGDGQSASQYAPITVEVGLANPTAIAIGTYTTCEIANQGRVWCWGANSSGEAGTGGTSAVPNGGGPGITFGRAAAPQAVVLVNSATGKPAGSSPSARKVKISWTAPSTTNGASTPKDYYVYYQLKGSSAWKKFADPVTTTRSATVTGLTAGKYYRFKVVPVNWAGAGSSSAVSGYIKSK